MERLRGLFVGTLLGAIAGLLAGALLAGKAVPAAFHGWPTVWRDVGPLVFIPLLLGVVAGVLARISRGSIAGLLLSLAGGAAAGWLAPELYNAAFGAPYPLPAGFASMGDIFPFLVAFCGAAAGLVWRLSIDKLIG